MMKYETIPVVVPGSSAKIQPSLTCYRLDNSPELPLQHRRPCVILCPGGAYAFRSDRESEPVAMRFLAAGIHVCILHYSIAPEQYPTAVLELAQAVRMVRSHADEWGVTSVMIAGFSAGGHLVASLGTLWNQPLFSDAFGDKADWKPDGMVLGYPVITMGYFTHEYSRECLLGKQPDPQLVDLLSLEGSVTAQTIPAFIWHTVADGAVPVENSLQFAAALRKAGVSFEMHLYENGGHGLSLCDYTTAQGDEHLQPDNAGWMDLAIRWIRRHAEEASAQ